MKQRVVLLLKTAGFFLFFILLIAGCSRREVVLNLSAEERFQRGMENYEAGQYVRAIEEFRIVTRQFSGSDYADDAQFYMGMSYFNRGEHILAANEFETLVNIMSASPLVPEAQYKMALSYYNLSPRYDLDQEFTLKAIDELQTFIDFFPTHELVPEAEVKIRELNAKLARKQYENGRLYMRMRYYRAATRYFDIVIERFHDTEYAELAFLGKAEALIERNMYEDANQIVQRFLRQFPNSIYRSRAQTLERRIASEMRGEGNGETNGPDTEQTTSQNSSHEELIDRR
jgi:outer membrane protein assembly factor BamD